jgi:SAM-dependent methyltransferase
MSKRRIPQEKTMSVQALREFINRHNSSAAGLAALAAALDERVTATALNPGLAAPIQDLLTALGLGDALEQMSVEELKPMLAELRFTLGIEAKLLYPQTRSTGWSHAESTLLQNAGDVSSGFVQPLARVVVPSLQGLSERFGAGGTFLDVGVGVASLSIAAARMWPTLRVVGVDPWRPSLDLARENVERAGLTGRIELLEQAAETLALESAFDLAWVPIPFIPDAVVAAVYEHVARALRPGGWMLVCAANPHLDPQAAALWRLRATLFGNPQTDAGLVEKRLRELGLAEVHTLPTGPAAMFALVAGRRSPA